MSNYEFKEKTLGLIKLYNKECKKYMYVQKRNIVYITKEKDVYQPNDDNYAIMLSNQEKIYIDKDSFKTIIDIMESEEQ